MRDVKPLAPGPARPVPAPKPAAPPPRPSARPAPTAAPPQPLDRLAGIDRANAERLKRGKHPIEGRLDLHGMTQDEAHRALAAFIRGSHAAGKRCVLVITGRGSIGGGVLRAAVPRWLEEPQFRPHLLAIAAAQPRDGGSGALYVMLRRTRTG
ncbi:MAG TPA: Smr/MutS family protein [Stellaceae bacterium]|nr:Smr/MutS family protein [Stellaceae bacterium]